jgi:hypothetical protein
MQSNRSISTHQDPFLPKNQKIADALTEHDKDLLERLHRGERHGLQLERIHGANKHVLTIRTNEKRRLFLWMKDSLIVVMHIMENHKHNNLDMGALEKSTLEFIFGRAIEGDVELIYEATDETPGFIPDKNFKCTEIKSATCYNQNLIVYDDNQALVLAKPLPVLLHGDFGSGKSALARTMLINAILQFKDVYPDKDFVYYSHLPDLVRYMQDQFLLDNPNIGTIINLERVKFLDTQGLVCEYGPIDISNKKPVGMAEFKAFLVEQHKNEVSKLKRKKTSPLTDININADVEVIYDEFQIITGMPTEKAYLALGPQASNYANPDIRKWLFGLVKLYEDRMKGRNEYDPCLTLWQVEETPLAFLVGDEMQGAPFSVVEMAARLVEGKNVMFCCDSNQSERRLSALPRIKVIFKEHKAPFEVCSMPGSYRSPSHMMPLINTVIGIKQYINGGLHDKHQAPVVKSKVLPQSHQGSIQLNSLEEIETVKNKLNDSGVLYVVITPEAYIDDAKKTFGDGVPVYTPRQARGMEFSVVVFYRLMSEPLPVKNKQKTPILLSAVIHDLIAGLPLKSDPAKHQPKPGKANPLYEPKLNDWVIALSRLVGNAAHCFVVETFNKQQASRLHAFVSLAIEEGQALIQNNGEGLTASTPDEWNSFALKNIEMGNRGQAWVAYRHLGKTEADLDAAIQSYHQNRQARIQSAGSATVNVVDRDKLNVDKAERLWSELKNAKEKNAALMRVLKSSTKINDLMLPLKSGKPVFLEVLGASDLAKPLYLIMIKNEKNQFFRKKIANLFAQFEWFKQYDDADGGSGFQLHWVFEDDLRSNIFFLAVDMNGSIVPFAFSEAKQLKQWLDYFFNKKSKTISAKAVLFFMDMLAYFINFKDRSFVEEAIFLILFEKEMREFFFELLFDLFPKARSDSYALLMTDWVMKAIDACWARSVQFGKTMVPLAFTVFLSNHSEKIGAYLELHSAGKGTFYEKHFNQATYFGRAFYIPKYQGVYPLLYVLAKECSPRFPLMMSMASKLGFKVDCCLLPFGDEQGQQESILSALLSNLVDADIESPGKLVVLSQALSGMMQLNDGLLVKAYIDQYIKQGLPIPSHSENLKKPRALFDACFYLETHFGGSMTRVIDSFGKTMLDTLTCKQIFEDVVIGPMPLFYYAIKIDSMLDALKKRFSMETHETRLRLEGDLYRALTKKEVTAKTKQPITWSALLGLLNEDCELDFLHALMKLFPGLARLMKLDDFKNHASLPSFHCERFFMAQEGCHPANLLLQALNGPLHRVLLVASIKQRLAGGCQNPVPAKPEKTMGALPLLSYGDYYRLIGLKDKKQGLKEMIERVPDGQAWVETMVWGQPFIISIFDDAELAAFLMLLLGDHQEKLDDKDGVIFQWVASLVTSMEWLAPYEQGGDPNYSNLHWMLEDKNRSLLLRIFIFMKSASPLKGFLDAKQLDKLRVSYDNASMGARLPLIVFLIIKNIEIAQILSYQNPLMDDLIMDSLFMSLSINGSEVSLLQYIQEKRMESLLDMFDGFLLAYSDARVILKIQADHQAILGSVSAAKAVAWCLEAKNRCDASQMIQRKDVGSLDRLLSSAAFPANLTLEMNNGKTILVNVMKDEILRVHFFNFIAKMPAEQFREKCNGIDFGFNELVQLGGHSMPFIISILKSQHSEALLSLFEGVDPEQFYKTMFNHMAQFNGVLREVKTANPGLYAHLSKQKEAYFSRVSGREAKPASALLSNSVFSSPESAAPPAEPSLRRDRP